MSQYIEDNQIIFFLFYRGTYRIYEWLFKINIFIKFYSKKYIILTYNHKNNTIIRFK